MKNERRDAIQNSLDHIESRIPERLNVDSLAAFSFFSKAQFQRLFREIMGEPVMEYVKKRRLRRACAALAETDESVLEIALRFGFESHEGFTRAFKAYFGVPPAHYRKKMKSIKERKIVLSNSLTMDINKHMKQIAERMAEAKNQMEEIVAAAVAVTDLTPYIGSMLVLIEEWKHFAERTGAISETARDFLKGGPAVCDLTDKVYAFLKDLDDSAFQMNVINCFSNIETARMGERENKLFTPVVKRFAGLADTIVSNKKDAAPILESLALMVREEIKNDAESKMNEISALLASAASKGEELTRKAREVAGEMGGYSGVFYRLANEIAKRTETFKFSFNALETAAFYMRIAAFNANIEAARTGTRENGNESVYACAEGLREYAGYLNKTHSECSSLYGEYEKLAGLLHGAPKADFTKPNDVKAISDILFQCEIIGVLLGVEADRAKKEAFKAVSDRIFEAVDLLTARGEKALREFQKLISSAAEDCRREAEACGPHGAAFAYIAAELGGIVKNCYELALL